MIESEENGCEGWGSEFKPYKVKYQIMREGEAIVCTHEDGNTLEHLVNHLARRAWNLGDFKVVILEEEEVESIYNE